MISLIAAAGLVSLGAALGIAVATYHMSRRPSFDPQSAAKAEAYAELSGRMETLALDNGATPRDAEGAFDKAAGSVSPTARMVLYQNRFPPAGGDDG